MTNHKLEMPALNGEPVGEIHARICRENGHATHTVAGKPTGRCPRCGEVTNTLNTRYGVEIIEIDPRGGGYIGTADGMGYGAPSKATHGAPTVPANDRMAHFDHDITDADKDPETGLSYLDIHGADSDRFRSTDGTGMISFDGIESASIETTDQEVARWITNPSALISPEVALRITLDFHSSCFLPDAAYDAEGRKPVNAGWFLEVALQGYADLIKWAERFDSVGNARHMHLVALAAWIGHNITGFHQ